MQSIYNGRIVYPRSILKFFKLLADPKLKTSAVHIQCQYSIPQNDAEILQAPHMELGRVNTVRVQSIVTGNVFCTMVSWALAPSPMP